MLSKLNYKFADDGTFWINFDDWIQQYNRFYVLRLFSNTRWKHAGIKGEWKGQTAGGCGNYATWKNNPQFGFSIDQEMDVFITLMQKDTRMEGVMNDPINVGFLILKTTGIIFKFITKY